MPITVRKILNGTAFILQEGGCESPRLDAEVLLSHLLGVERIEFYTHPERVLDEGQRHAYARLVERRLLGEPVAYITGVKEFMGLEFKVGPGVLIPRPESETVVETALELMEGRLSPAILDICCGSGALGISLKSLLGDGATLTLSDISPEALSYARTNLNKLEIEGQIVEGDLFENVFNRYDIVMANPPYIAQSDMASLQREIRKYEPQIALCGGISGYLFYDRIIGESGAYLKEGSPLVFEVGDGQAREVARRLKRAGFVDIGVKKDLLGIERCVYAFYPKVPVT